MKWVPDGCELIQVTIMHEYGVYDEPDTAYFGIYWKEIE